MSTGELRELVEWAESRLPELVEDVTAEVRDRIDLYRDDQVVTREELRRSIEVNLRFILAALPDPRNASADVAAPRETGKDRAQQGAPLPEVLQVYRIGCGRLWELLVDRARQQSRPEAVDALVDATSALWQLADEHALLVTESYRAASAELLVVQQRRRSALVEALMTGQQPASGPWEAGKLLGLVPNSCLAVVVAETRGLAEESLLGIERRLAELGIVSAWHLGPAWQAGIVSVSEETYDLMVRAVREAATSRTGVSPPYQRLSETPRARHFARVALSGLPAKSREVRVFSRSPLAGLIASDPEEGERLARDVLGAMLDLPGEDRDALLDTLEAYFENGGAAAPTSRALHCHPNTVRYRLRRIRELTGRSLGDPRSLAELVTASWALNQGRGRERAEEIGSRPTPPGEA